MSIEEIEAILVDLEDEQFNELLDRVMTRRHPSHDDIDSEVLEAAHRRSDDMRSGRVKPVPFEQLLDDLDRLAS
jgi:hypothetical protein